MLLVLLLLGVAAGPAWGTSTAMGLGVSLRKNPIRKVVTLIQDMQKSVQQEGEKDAELYDKFMCYCKTTGASLTESISKRQAEIEEDTNEAESQSATKSQLEQEIEGHKADRAEAEKQMKEAASIREKEEAEFAQASGDMKTNIESLASALEALQKSGSSALLQTPGFGSSLRDTVLRNTAVAEEDRSALLSLLSAREGESTEGSSDQIIGIISQMLDETKSALADFTASEAQRKTDHEALSDAKSKEIKAATLAIEEKMDRAAQCAVKAVEAKSSLDAGTKSMTEDQALKATLTKQCAQKEKEYEEVQKTRMEELTAMSEAVKVLNSDDALELFKKTAPSASFLQTSSHSTLRAHLRFHSSLRVRGHSRVRRVRARAVSSKGFEKVVKMVDGMIGILTEGQTTDAEKKENCLLQTQKLETELKELEATVQGITSSVEAKKNDIATISAEVDATKAGITELDKSVAEATAQRKEEHEAFVASTAANNAALDLLRMAANKLNKFYDPKSYVAPTEEPDLLQTGDAGQDGIFFAQIRSRSRSRYQQMNSGIFALLAEIEKEISLKMGEEKHDEEAAQKAYEESMGEAAGKRAADSKGIVEHEVETSEMRAHLEDLQASESEKGLHLKLASQKLADIHKFCDAFLEAFEERQKAREQEIENDKSSQQILSGMDTAQ